MKKHIPGSFLILLCFQLFAGILSAQEKFDIISFKTPVGWQKDVKPEAVQFTVQNKSDNIFAVMMLFKSLPASDDSKKNFNASWDVIVKGSVTKVSAPDMSPVTNENGWIIESGTAQYEDSSTKGTAMLVSATGGGTVVNLLIMTNTDAYQPKIMGFLGSIVLPKVEPQKALAISQTNPSKSSNASSAPIVGYWSSYINETSGFINGYAQTTGGYFRKEYRFSGDGTYIFLEKDFAAYSKTIVFKSETGNWSVSGNRLTISPAAGKVQTWSKSASGRNNEWGNLLKTENGKLEKITYTFEMKYLSGMEQNYLVLSHNAPTERDGTQNNNANQPQIWQYSSLTPNKALIDIPSK